MDIDGDIDYTAEKKTWRCSAEDVTVLPWRIHSQIEEAECYFHQIIKLMVIKDIREGFEVRWNGLTFFQKRRYSGWWFRTFFSFHFIYTGYNPSH